MAARKNPSTKRSRLYCKVTSAAGSSVLVLCVEGGAAEVRVAWRRLYRGEKSSGSE